MNNKMVFGSITFGALMLAGLIGIITAWSEKKNETKQVVFDEINDSPIGI